VGAAVLGTLLVVAGWVMQGRDYVPGLLLQIGSSLLLAVPLLLLGRVLEARLRRTEARAESISSGLADVRTQLDEATARIEDLGDATRERIQQQREDDQSALRAAEQDISHASLVDLLARATRSGVVAAQGIRVQVPGAARWLRIRLDDRDGLPALTLTLENRAGRAPEPVRWPAGEPPQALAERLIDALHATGAPAAADLFDATELFRRVLGTLRCGFDNLGGLGGVCAIIEAPNDQWAITTDGLRSFQPPYRIPTERMLDLGEDWPRHMRQKDWVDDEKFIDAYRVALDLYR
jgi:hypothetical protein